MGPKEIWTLTALINALKNTAAKIKPVPLFRVLEWTCNQQLADSVEITLKAQVRKEALAALKEHAPEWARNLDRIMERKSVDVP